MKYISLLISLIVSVVLTGMFACRHGIDAKSTVCRLTGTTDQVVEANGRLTEEMQRTFTYTNDVLTSIAERSTNQEASFALEHTDQRTVRATGVTATGGAMAVTLGYALGVTQPASATFSRGGNAASTFVMDYNSDGRMSRIVESRTVLPANSRTTERVFTFTYDNAGNLTTERVRSTLVGGVVVDQETEYAVAANPSPYVHFSERALLTLLALSQAVETRPGRFWHRTAPTAYKSYFLTNSGSRGNLSESSTFVATYDADSKLMGQDQNALLYQLSLPEPITKRSRQSFTYQCD